MKRMKEPKVLIFTPIYEAKDYSLERFLKNSKKFEYKNHKHILIDNSVDEKYYKRVKRKVEAYGFEIYRVRRGKTSREALTRAQNFARTKFLNGDYDYLVSIESDIFPPPNFLRRLLSWGEAVISATYLIGDERVKVPCITLFDYKEELGVLGTRLLGIKPVEGTNKKRVDREEIIQFVNPPGLKRVAAAGMGCCVMHRSVMEKIRFMYEPGLNGHSDIYFFNDCHRFRIPVYVDTHIWCYHENSSWKDVADR